MRKLVLLLVLIFGGVLFAQQGGSEMDMPLRGRIPRQQINPQEFCTKHDLIRYLNSSAGGEAVQTQDLSRAGISLLPGSSWEPIGPEGGNVIGLALNPANSNEIFAVTYSYPGEVYKTTDGGVNWKKLSSLSSYLYDIAVDPANPNILYTLGNNYIYKSFDGGLNWTSYYFGSYRYGYYGRIAICPGNSSIIYVCGYAYYDTTNWKYSMTVFKSTNGGMNWSAKSMSLTSQAGQSYSLCIDPANANVIYLGGVESDGSSWFGRVYKSTDAGDNWANITGSIIGYVYMMVIDPTNTSRVYAGTYSGIFRSSDGGSSWTKNSGYAYAYALAIDPSNPAVLYAGYSKSIFKSVDYGVNWAYYSGGLYGSCEDLIASPTKVFYGSSAGIYRSGDGGVSWQESHRGMLAAVIPALAVAPSAPNTVYAEVQSNGFFKSSDYGSNWTRLPDFYRCESILKVFVNPSNANDVFILSGG
jgi:photosystem II stability/assembly factor-like uncharacterized protein